MDKDKDILLEKTSNNWVALCFGDLPISRSNDMVLPDVMGYGTTLNEKITGIRAYKKLILEGIEQRKHLKNFNYTISPVYNRSLGDDTVLVVNEIKLMYLLEENEIVLDLRLSTVYVYKASKWMVLHWHGSLGMDEEDGTWHQEEWKRENEKLQKKVDEQTKELKKSLAELKATQSQLIHSEKMASLGELTAGIAHEIQNPLNFVNNFSEVSNELIDEIQEERAKNIENRDEELVDEILGDIKQNLEKINHHGKRADSIVKGMLQHSRASSGKKEPTDLNALADEYLRLAYHGLRAKDKSFNADYKTDFDPNLPKVNVVSQDIGRVLLNLINNAFQAVNERGKKGASGYKPEVSVETKLTTKNKTLITIRDNGPGIPDHIKEKIFQPFFTTKPTGSGTGLGLSLSYDIVKAHGGEISVESEQGVGTEFIVALPFKINQ